ncbi:M50 family metallopeptidase [Qipengyuania qiaonensis]|uniref:M50 family metallopeptidase n=1 Tax=Qipengyuania qiaonensis TaxID=2867240 RepID=A0ABS7J210_9SPHN|nr:M50 family metallopeptidase [Qipengyuania qiaonensis]MBX7481370.1 M50 family metallopeptidase [Qipengyuania qiaonensis]
MKENAGQPIVPAKWGIPYAQDEVQPMIQREQSYIVAFAVLTIIAWQTAIGTLVLMPFTLLATWFHEMAHGLTAAALGAEFERLVIFANGSGFAEYSGNLWAIGQATVAAAGLLGPSIAGCLMIIASRSRRATRIVLLGLGAALVLSTLIWVRSVAGWVVLPIFAAASFYIALRGNEKWQRIAVEFLGVQGAVSVYQDLGYLFSPGGSVDGRVAISDTGRIADALFLPYWFWGGLITFTIFAMVWKSLKIASRY